MVSTLRHEPVGTGAGTSGTAQRTSSAGAGGAVSSGPVDPRTTSADLGRAHVTREAIAGLTSFLTMAYIVVVNPSILATEGTGMPFSGVLTATVLVCFTMTLLMGL